MFFYRNLRVNPKYIITANYFEERALFGFITALKLTTFVREILSLLEYYRTESICYENNMAL